MKNGTETVNDFLNGLQEGNEHLVDVARKMTEDKDGKVKENITFALQKRELQPEPPTPRVHAESPRRNHTFASVESFVDYLSENKTKKTVVLADINQSTISAVLDESAKGGFEFVSFRPQIHPLFRPWLATIDSITEVKEFALFLQQNKRTVATPEVQELTLLFSHIRASQKIVMHKGIGAHSLNGLTCEVNIIGKQENKEVELPDTIVIDVPIFIDTPSMKIDVDLIVGTEDTDVHVICSSSDYKVKVVDAFEDMLRKVREVEGIIVGFGTVQTNDWNYLR